MAKPTEPAKKTGDTGIPAEAILEQMERILATPEFRRSSRSTDFLRFVVAEKLAGRGDLLSSHRIAHAVFGRDESFDPILDPIVRNQASRLRRALERYFFQAGARDPIRIDLPRGGYVPTFERATDAARRRPGRLVDDVAYDLPRGPSIAVIPFLDLGEHPDQQFFADGLVEELVVELSRFQDFVVFGRQSTAKYAGGMIDVREIGQELRVRYVLTGNVRRSTHRVRVSVKLADTRTGALLWAERFEGDLAAPEIFDIQDGIVSRVVSKVADSFGVIPRALARASSRKRTNELSSYEAVLRYHHYSVDAPIEKYGETREGLELAVERDPEYAPAWAKLSEMLTDGFVFGYSDEPHLLDRAKEFAQRAISLDPECQEGYSALLWCAFHRRERHEVLEAAAKVIELNPNAALALGHAGYCMALAGEWDEGLALIDKALRLNPHNPGWLLVPRCVDHLRSAEYEEALETARKIANPVSEERLFTEAAALGHLGRTAEGERVIAMLLERRPDFERTAASSVRRYMFFDELADLILEGLQKAGLTLADR